MGTVNINDLGGPYTFYMEGVRVKWARIQVVGEEQGYTTFNVDLPFDSAKRKIKKIRPKTKGEIYFGNKLFLLFDGELVRKKYKKTPRGPMATFFFNGVGGNLAMMKYGLQSSADQGGAVAHSADFAGLADLWILSGLSLGATQAGNAAVNPSASEIGYFATTINQILIASPFLDGLVKAGGGGQFDMAEAFRSMMRAFIYGGASPGGQTTGITVNGTLAASYLGVVDGRFRLIDSFLGATAQELIKVFYGADQKNKDQINTFLNAILSQSVTGEQNLLEVMRLLAYRAFHSITEMVAPPMLQSDTAGLALGRFLMTPRLFAADPPVCNVFFPQMVNNVDSDINVLKTTRLITTQSLPANGNAPVAVASISPLDLEAKTVSQDENTGRRFNFANAITQEESEVGVLASVQPNFYGASTVFDAKEIAPWFDKTNPLRFYVIRSEDQTSNISMEFNPFVAVGFPGLFFDPDLEVGRGMVSKVVHTITPRGAVTNVLMTQCIFEDDCEFPQKDINFEDGFGGRLETFKNGNPNDVYKKLLGCESLFTAGSDASAAAKPSLSDIANGLYNSFINIGSSSSEKTAIYKFIARNIASFGELETFYSGGTNSLVTVFDRPPAQISLGKPYADPANGTTVTVQGKGSAPFVIPAGQQPSDFQILDRITPVIDYVNEIGD